jgi:isopenicillin-N N-acyltransferase-like protein
MRLHRHDSGSSAADRRGREVGERLADQIALAVTAYRRHFDELGIHHERVVQIANASLDALTSWSPPHRAELDAIAAGARRPIGDLALLNARTEILASAPREGECSTVVRVPTPAAPTAPIVAFQTWDWRPELAEDGLLWRYGPTPGRWVKTFTECGMLAKIGVSSAGLAVHFNILHHQSDTASGGVPVHAIARRILDEADTVEEAVDVVRSARVGASTAITVVSARGGRVDAASLEIAPAGVGVLRPGRDGWLVRTNHFLSPELASGDRYPTTSTTKTRLDHLASVVSGDVVGDDLPSLAGSLCGPAGATAPICLDGDVAAAAGLVSRTLLTVRLDPATGVFECRPGTPHQAAVAGAAERV